MAMDISLRTLADLDKLDAVFRRHNEPGENTSALNQVRALCIGIHGHHAYITEKAVHIMDLADIYYSERKYLKHSGGPGSLMAQMSYQLPNAIRSQLSYLESLPENQQSDD